VLVELAEAVLWAGGVGGGGGIFSVRKKRAKNTRSGKEKKRLRSCADFYREEVDLMLVSEHH